MHARTRPSHYGPGMESTLFDGVTSDAGLGQGSREVPPPPSPMPAMVDVSKAIPETMRKTMLRTLDAEDLRSFQEVFRYHRNQRDPGTDWSDFVPEDLHAPIRRRLQNLVDPLTQVPKHTAAAAARWREMDVLGCMDDLINAKSLPAVAGLPLVTALGALPLDDRLLEVEYYEVLETMLTKTYKTYGKSYEDERLRKDLSLSLALSRSFKSTTSGNIVNKLIKQDDPLQKGYIPDSVGQYIDSAALHAAKKAALDHSARLYKGATWDEGPAKGDKKSKSG